MKGKETMERKEEGKEIKIWKEKKVMKRKEKREWK